MKRIFIFMLVAMSIVACKERGKTSANDEAVKGSLELGENDTLIVKGPAIVFNPYSIDKDNYDKDTVWMNMQSIRYTEQYESMFGAYGYKVYATKAKTIFFTSDNGKVTDELVTIGGRYSRMATMVPGSSALIFEKWTDQNGLEKAILGKGL